MAVNILNATNIIGQTVARQKTQTNNDPYTETVLTKADSKTIYKVNVLNAFTTFRKRGNATDFGRGEVYLELYYGTVLLNSELMFADRYVTGNYPGVRNETVTPNAQAFDPTETIRGISYHAENVTDVFNWEQRDEIPSIRRKFNLISKEQPLYISDQASLELKVKYTGIYADATVGPTAIRLMDISFICSYEEIIV